MNSCRITNGGIFLQSHLFIRLLSLCLFSLISSILQIVHKHILLFTRLVIHRIFASKRSFLHYSLWFLHRIQGCPWQLLINTRSITWLTVSWSLLKTSLSLLKRVWRLPKKIVLPSRSSTRFKRINILQRIRKASFFLLFDHQIIIQLLVLKHILFHLLSFSL